MKLKKSLALILSVVMMLSCMVFSSVSASAYYEDNSSWTAISTQAQLQAITTSGMSGNYYLTCDIEITGTFTPIGKTSSTSSSYTVFSGTFDGQGYTISGLDSNYGYGNTAYCGGLFAYNSGTIKNLNLEDISVDGAWYVGALVGQNSGTIYNVNLVDANVYGYVNTTTNGKYIGGLVGQNLAGGTITYCTVTNVSIAGNLYVGGLTGVNKGTVSYCNVTDVTFHEELTQTAIKTSAENNWSSVTTYSYYGGLIGQNQSTVEYCTVEGSIVLKGYAYLGGIIGSCYSGSVKNCSISYTECEYTTYTLTYLNLKVTTTSNTVGVYGYYSNNTLYSNSTSYSNVYDLNTSTHSCSSSTTHVIAEETDVMEGVTRTYCSTCGSVVSETTTPSTGTHTCTYTSEVTTPATCTSTGVRTYTCTVCGDVYTEDVEAYGHTWIVTDDTDENGWEVTQEATCCKAGNMQRQCSVCTSYVQYETIPLTGEHTYGDDGYCTTTGCTAYDESYDLTLNEEDEEDEDAETNVEVEGDTDGNVETSYEQDKKDAYKVVIEWGSLEFNYTDAATEWNVDTMTWETVEDSEGAWTYEKGANEITITNSSSQRVLATIGTSSVYGGIEITASEEAITIGSPALGDATWTKTFEITVSGYDSEFTSAELEKIGSVTIKLAAEV